MDAVKAGLSDKHPYPRKAAAMGVLKIMDYAPEAVERAQLLHIVRILLMDDPSPEARNSPRRSPGDETAVTV